MMEMASPLQNDHYFVKVLIDQSNYFVRDNFDIYTEADVSVSQALLGGKLNIRGLYEEKVIHT
jgi:DnaJ-class molecular chaperone